MKQFFNNFQNLREFHLKSTGSSMLPILHPQDVLYFKRIDFRRVQINDLAMVKKGGRVFTHRVIYKSANRSYLITKGDHNITSDGKIYPQQIIGRVYQVKRQGQIFNPDNLYLLQSTQYFQEIVKVKKVFEKEKIDFVFLKGLPLHLYFEKSHPRRIYADCDILISKNDWQRAQSILKGFKYTGAETSYSGIHKLLKDKMTEFSFYKNIKNFPVVFDVHLEAGFLMNQLGRLDALYAQSLIDEMTRQLLNKKQMVKIQKEQFPILSFADLIIYLSLHIFHHNCQGVFQFEFLDKVTRKALLVSSPGRSRSLQHSSPLGNPYLPATPGVFLSLIEKIRRYKLQNFVYPVFLMLEKYYNLHLPKKFLESIKPANNRLNYIYKNILPVNIFDYEPRIETGITRFKNLFFLSPYPLSRRILIVFNLQVIYSFLWVIIFLVKRSFTKVFRSL